MIDGTAAIRATIETIRPLIRTGAYSLMNSAVASASGNAKVIATIATVKVPSSTPAMPTLPWSGAHWFWVKKPGP